MILTDKVAKELSFDGESYEFDGRIYYLLHEPELGDYRNNVAYSASAIRVGDEIEDNWVVTHDIYWDLLSPKELGYRVCETTAVDTLDCSKGYFTVDDFNKKYGVLSVKGDGDYVPISPISSEEINGEMVFLCHAIRYDDELTDDSEIKVYDVSYFASDANSEKDRRPLEFIASNGIAQTYFVDVINFIDCLPFKDYSWSVEPYNACDWKHPSFVKESESISLERFFLKQKEKRDEVREEGISR